MTTASAVARALKSAGIITCSGGRNQEGIRVTGRHPGGAAPVHVVADFRDDDKAQQHSIAAEKALQEAGFAVRRSTFSQIFIDGRSHKT